MVNKMAQKTQEELQNQIKNLEKEMKSMRDEMDYFKQSPYMQTSIANLHYEVILDRMNIIDKELGQKFKGAFCFSGRFFTAYNWGPGSSWLSQGCTFQF